MVLLCSLLFRFFLAKNLRPRYFPQKRSCTREICFKKPGYISKLKFVFFMTVPVDSSKLELRIFLLRETWQMGRIFDGRGQNLSVQLRLQLRLGDVCARAVGHRQQGMSDGPPSSPVSGYSGSGALPGELLIRPPLIPGLGSGSETRGHPPFPQSVTLIPEAYSLRNQGPLAPIAENRFISFDRYSPLPLKKSQPRKDTKRKKRAERAPKSTHIFRLSAGVLIYQKLL